MKYGSLCPTDSFNLGDEIQAIAVERLLPRVDLRIDRMTLEAPGATEPVVVVMNGWFGPPGMPWPPSGSITPSFFGFHISDRHSGYSRFTAGITREFYSRNSPIGCRDSTTDSILKQAGIESFVSSCATQTLPRREREPDRGGKVYIVNGDAVPIPRSLRRSAIRISQHVHPGLRSATKRSMAEDLLTLYRDTARLVITTKIHCAMPCAAMGIPTVFIGDPDNPRIEPAGEVLPINPFRRGPRIVRRVQRTNANLKFLRSVDWDPEPPEFEDRKRTMTQVFQQQLELAENRASGT